jgi:hypothetical protein
MIEFLAGYSFDFYSFEFWLSTLLMNVPMSVSLEICIWFQSQSTNIFAASWSLMSKALHLFGVKHTYFEQYY